MDWVARIVWGGKYPGRGKKPSKIVRKTCSKETPDSADFAPKYVQTCTKYAKFVFFDPKKGERCGKYAKHMQNTCCPLREASEGLPTPHDGPGGPVPGQRQVRLDGDHVARPDEGLQQVVQAVLQPGLWRQPVGRA